MSILALGFRPFYALASIFAVGALLLWMLASGGLSGSGVYLDSLAWHGHEMLFGFAAAVVAGFLFTAVRNWTGLPTPSGLALLGLALLWCAARLLIVTGPAELAALVDIAFLPAVALAISIPILRSKNVRNYKVLVIVVALAGLNALFHAAAQGVLPAAVQRLSLLTGIDVLVILLALVAGRVVPAFTGNAVPDASPRSEYWVELASFGSLVIIACLRLADSSSLSVNALAMLYLVAAAAHATRLGLWDPVKTLANPLLWMMPAAYSWLPFAFFLQALAALGVVSGSAAIHAVTIGAISSFMLAMMIRSSLGHTGRPLVASRADMAAFLLLQLAAATRVGASIYGGPLYRDWVLVAGVLWVLAFLIFAIRFLPMLARARIDD